MNGRRRVFFAAGASAVLVCLLLSAQASAIPAFARKYGLDCTACHEAWPALNDFGRAFRDEGYQLLQGKDAPTTAPPPYFPVSMRLTPHYEFTMASHQRTDQGTQSLKTGGISDIGLDLLVGGTLFDNVSFLVVPTGFTSSDGVTLESAWVRFSNLGGSSWLNLKLGKHGLDLPRSSHRAWNLSSTGYLIYAYHAPGSLSVFDLGENQRGVEWVGHDRGSLTRAAISVFNVEGSPGSRGGFDTPGVYAHVTRQWFFDRGHVSAFRIGAFGSYTTWPTSTLTVDTVPIPGQGGDLKASTKMGFDTHVWLGPAVTPLHIIVAAAHGQDDQALITGATGDGTFNGGYVEAGYTPTLKTTVFGRYDIVRNQVQGVVDRPRGFNDKDAWTMGLRHTFRFTHNDEYALHAEYSIVRTRFGAEDGLDVMNHTVFLGIDFAF